MSRFSRTGKVIRLDLAEKRLFYEVHVQQDREFITYKPKIESSCLVLINGEKTEFGLLRPGQIVTVYYERLAVVKIIVSPPKNNPPVPPPPPEPPTPNEPVLIAKVLKIDNQAGKMQLEHRTPDAVVITFERRIRRSGKQTEEVMVGKSITFYPSEVLPGSISYYYGEWIARERKQREQELLRQTELDMQRVI